MALSFPTPALPFPALSPILYAPIASYHCGSVRCQNTRFEIRRGDFRKKIQERVGSCGAPLKAWREGVWGACGDVFGALGSFKNNISRLRVGRSCML